MIPKSKKRPLIYFAILFSICLLILGLAMTNKNEAQRDDVLIYSSVAPFSVDPIDYDSFVHHVAFTSIFANLITQYEKGKISGVIADEWQSSDDWKTWKLHIRNAMRFENGDLITPEIVKTSLTRIAFLMKEKKSKSGLIENLAGIEKLTGPVDDFEGIKIDGSYLVLSFNKPLKNMLELISFGLYSIVHPNDFDHATGLWKDKKSAISSGAYKITKWDDTAIEVTKRADFNLTHPNVFKRYKFTANTELKDKADLILALSTEEHAGYEFKGTTSSNIAYMQCFSWNETDSPCSDLQVRKTLRFHFYKYLEQHSFQHTKSFFPLVLPNVKEFELEDQLNQIEKNDSSKFKRKVRFGRVSPKATGILEVLAEATKYAVNTLGFEFEESFVSNQVFIHNVTGGPSKHDFDFSRIVTGILIENPFEDVRFMVQSKEGIRLPDPSKKLHEITDKDEFEVGEVNQQLWDDAIVWPVQHLGLGLWARKGMFDFSKINLVLPSTDISWIGRGSE